MRGIITADNHLRHTPPKVNCDDWDNVQKKMIERITEICIERNCDLYNVGDLYNSVSDTTYDLVSMVQTQANVLGEHKLKFYLLAGNHDLPFHSSSNLDKCAMGVTLRSPNIYHMNCSEEVRCANFDEETPEGEIIAKHILCFPDMESIPPNVNAVTAPELLHDYPKAKWIFLGDYHHAYHYERKGRHVINPGCTSIQVADMTDYECGVYYVDTDSETVEWIPLNIAQKFYDKTDSETDVDMEAFAEGISMKGVTFDFETNIENALLSQDNDVKNKVHSWKE